ncbi:hypothetical protein MOQ72_43660 [Saccharopolyspora sp. K220]|uniref:hypothetical protein n=1 Tax=Saccharopolyspora soli TaxID=2926618 RepID=UPI001F560C91|nr:hypothetical protein [Saccharopolyspora soli]MCI2424312.1 hypothetical protein [Saccharopolyspora soli]
MTAPERTADRIAVNLAPPGQIAIPEQTKKEIEPQRPTAAAVNVTLGEQAALPAGTQGPRTAVHEVDGDPQSPVAADSGPNLRSEGRVLDVVMQRLREIVIQRLQPKTEPDEPPARVVLVTIGVLAVSAVTAAFILSYTMLHLVTQAVGWTGWVGRIGPVVPDVTAAAAAALLVYRTERGLAWFLLIASTGMSILGNLAGHAIWRGMGSTLFRLPAEWSWVGDVFSVFVPTGMALLLHVFLKKLSAFLVWRKKEKQQEAAAARRVAEEHAAAEREKARRAKQVAAEQMRREQAKANLRRAPKSGDTPSWQVGKEFALAFEFYNSSDADDLGYELEKKGWARGGFSSRKKWIQLAAKEVGADQSGTAA